MAKPWAQAWPAVALSCAIFLVVMAPPAHAMATWLSPLSVAEAGQGSNAQVAAAMDDRGDMLVVWVQTNQAHGVIEAAWRSAGGTFQAPVDLSPGDDAEAEDPVVAMDAQGDATIVWRTAHDYPGFRSLRSVTRSASGQFGEVAEPDNTNHEDYDPLVAMDAQGDTTIAWVLYNDNNYLIAERTSLEGEKLGPLKSVSLPEVYTEPTSNATAPALAMNASGDTGIAWLDVEPPQYFSPPEPAWVPSVQLATRPAAGSFSEPVGPYVPSWEPVIAQGPPTIAMDPNGEPTAIWSSLRAGEKQSIEVFSPTPPHEAPRASGVLAKETGASLLEPTIAMNAGGDTTVAWSSPSQAVTAVTRPAGGVFGNPITITGPSACAGKLAVAVDKSGDSVVVWMGSGGFVEASTRADGGSFGAPVKLSAGGETLGSITAAFDSQGNAMATWMNFDGTNDIAQLAGYQADGPSLEGAQIPTEGQAGIPLTFSVSPLSLWSTISSTSWSWDDGSPDSSGESVTHVFGDPGVYRVAVKAADTLGNVTSTARSITIRASTVDPPGTIVLPPIDPPRVKRRRLEAAVADFTPLFATRAATAGNTLGLLVGIAAVKGVHTGDKIVIRCIAGCRRRLQESLLVGGHRNTHGTITISPPLPLLGTTRIEMQVLTRGRVTRFAQYRFVRMRRGVIAYVAHQGCLSSAGRSLRCP
ncbi:MAG: PKD domain-containing protein [Solirubrobacteraceae bacterium]